jgi:hypothetical protein
MEGNLIIGEEAEQVMESCCQEEEVVDGEPQSDSIYRHLQLQQS